MTFRGQEPLVYRLAKVEPLREFVDETPVGDIVVRVSHRLEELGAGRLRITYTAELEGPREQTQRSARRSRATFLPRWPRLSHVPSDVQPENAVTALRVPRTLGPVPGNVQPEPPGPSVPSTAYDGPEESPGYLCGGRRCCGSGRFGTRSRRTI